MSAKRVKKAARRSKSGSWVSISSKQKTDAIVGALNNEKYFARTFEGIARELGVNRKDIVDTIKDNSELRESLKIYRRRSTEGKYLVTTKSKFTMKASIKDKFVDVFSSNKVRIEDV